MIKEFDLTSLHKLNLTNTKFKGNLINITNIKEDLNLNPFSKYIIYIINGEVVAFANYLIMYEKVDIANIVVHESYRQQNIASAMIKYVINEALEKKCETITLEVRKSNLEALGLYKKFGFQEVAIREKYYNGEDGILMEKKLVIQ